MREIRVRESEWKGEREIERGCVRERVRKRARDNPVCKYEIE